VPKAFPPSWPDSWLYFLRAEQLTAARVLILILHRMIFLLFESVFQRAHLFSASYNVAEF
jgi:hypothetical protein